MTTALLVTESFPLGGLTEEAFVMPGILALAEAFDRVIVVPVSERGPVARGLPANVTVARDIIEAPGRYRKWLRPLLHPIAMLLSRGDIRYSLSAAMTGRALRRLVVRMGLTASDTVAEAFWFDFPSSALASLHRSLGIRYVIRAHGYDIYSRRARAMRRDAIAASDGLYTVSQAGASFLRERFPEVAADISTAYLGVDTDVAPARHSPPGSRSVSFLTIAQVIDRKRCALCLDLVNALALARPGWSVAWTLIGDGPLIDELRARSSAHAPNLTVTLAGSLPHSGVMDYLSSATVDWLMLLSRAEGLGIAILEAMARGIPAIATDVGGIPEAVGDEGILLPPDPAPDEFVMGLIPYLDSPARYSALSAAARRRAATMFCASTLRAGWTASLRSLLP